MASPVFDDADNVNDKNCEDNTSIASGIRNSINKDDNDYEADESYATTSTATTRTTATVTMTTTDEVTCDVNINEGDRDIALLKVSLEIIKISPWSLFLVHSR